MTQSKPYVWALKGMFVFLCGVLSIFPLALFQYAEENHNHMGEYLFASLFFLFVSMGIITVIQVIRAGLKNG